MNLVREIPFFIAKCSFLFVCFLMPGPSGFGEDSRLLGSKIFPDVLF